MGRSTTSFRLDDELRERLARRAEHEGVSVNALAERLLNQGLAMIEHPGVTFNPGPTGWRATLPGGADVWEVMSAVRRWSDVSEAEKIAGLAQEFGVHEQVIIIALNYAAAHRDEIDARVNANDAMWAEAERLERARHSLLT
jgi:hypothetical protein